MNQEIELMELEECPKNANLVIGFPDVGLVGIIATSFLVKKLEMKTIGYMDSSLFPPVLPFHNNRPHFPVRITTDGNIVVIFSEIAVPVKSYGAIAETIIEYAVKNNVRSIIMLGGIAVQNRIEIEKPSVYILPTKKEILEEIKLPTLKSLDEGFLAGIYAVIVKEIIKRDLKGYVLLAESHLGYPDPGAAASVLEALSNILNLDIDTKPLLEQEEELRLHLKDLMKRTVETLRSAQKTYEQTPPLLYR